MAESIGLIKEAVPMSKALVLGLRRTITCQQENISTRREVASVRGGDKNIEVMLVAEENLDWTSGEVEVMM